MTTLLWILLIFCVAFIALAQWIKNRPGKPRRTYRMKRKRRGKGGRL